MKTYADYIDEISPDDLLTGLLGFGMFDDKLPPMFSSRQFADYFINNAPGFRKAPRSFVKYQCIRHSDGMRIMGIPHPLSYANLCKCLSVHWERIGEKLKANVQGQPYKISRVHLRKLTNGHLFKMNYSDWGKDGDPVPEMQVRARYQVESDITQCFPSIYTHAVPWALAGKQEAKEHQNNSRIWYNKIDKQLRYCTSNETHGILIGPHASNLIAEIILTTIDADLAKNGFAFVRSVDDYKCFAKTHEEAEEFIKALDACLFEYGLMRNQSKTRIRQLPLPSQSEWPRALKSFPLPQDTQIRRGQALAFLDYAVDLVKSNGDDGAILNYALRMLTGKPMTPYASELISTKALQFVRLYPYLAPIFEELVVEPYSVDAGKIELMSHDLCLYSKRTRVWFPSYYAIYYALKYGFRLPLTVDDAIDSGDCVLKALEFAYAKARGNYVAQKKLREDASAIVKSGDAEQNWLFVYEALPAEELADPDLSAMKKAGVSFLQQSW